jgi:hypothetical protein
MNLFGKKTPKIPRLTCFVIRVNVTELDQWVQKEGTIEPLRFSKWDRDHEVLKFEIQLLPTENFAFFHKNTQNFSASLNASITIHEEDNNRLYVC